jgi:hypothetical protein
LCFCQAELSFDLEIKNFEGGKCIMCFLILHVKKKETFWAIQLLGKMERPFCGVDALEMMQPASLSNARVIFHKHWNHWQAAKTDVAFHSVRARIVLVQGTCGFDGLGSEGRTDFTGGSCCC